MARWDKLRTRGNVEDRRGVGRPSAAVGGLGVVVVLLMSMLGGGGSGLENIVGQLQETQVPQQASVQPEEFQGEDDYEVFASTVLGSTDETWGQIFVASELTYAEPTLYSSAVPHNRHAGARTRRSVHTIATRPNDLPRRDLLR